MTYPLYDTNSGRCKVCGADTLWGDAPHESGCELAKLLAELDLVAEEALLAIAQNLLQDP